MNLSERQARVIYLTERLSFADADEVDELEAQIVGLLEGLAQEESDRIVQLTHIADRYAQQAEACAEAQRVAASRRKFWESRGARLRTHLAGLLERRRERTGSGVVSSPLRRVRLQRNAPRVVGPDDVDAWAEEGWIRVKEEPHKDAAKAFLRATDPEEWPEGFRLESTESVRWK